ncbi:MAG TPA: hypothetical protein VJ000_01240 [Thermodesulfovibrionia bacterium]|nr:hypothetical protein [Thermodesulfovibrionia bacterium]
MPEAAVDESAAAAAEEAVNASRLEAEAVEAEANAAKAAEAAPNDPAAPAEADKKKWQESVQKRIDELVAEREVEKHRNQLLSKEIEGLKENFNKGNAPEWTIEKVRDALMRAENGDAEYAPHKTLLQEKLIDLKSEEKFNILRKQTAKEAEAMASYQKAVAEFPELSNTESPLRKKANEVFNRYELSNVKDNQYLAAKLAYQELNEQDFKAIGVLKKQKEKADAKASLATGGGKPALSSTAVLDKLRDAAESTGTQQDWNLYYLKRNEQRKKS